MKNSLLDHMIEGVVDWKNRQGDIGKADGPKRLFEAAFAMEKAMASLVQGQSGHTIAFLLAAKTHPKEEAIPLLFHALQSSNLWLEAMMMLQWMAFRRIKGMASFFEWEKDLAGKPEQAVQAVEACRLSWIAMYSLALAFIRLVEQIMPDIAHPRRPLPDLRQAEQQMIQMFEQLDDLFRVLLRKSDFVQNLLGHPKREVEASVRELRFALFSSLSDLEGYSASSVVFSTSFKQKWKYSVELLKKYGEPGGPVRSVVQSHVSYQAPWLNREVLPGGTKSHKVVGPSKKWMKEP
ncbi:hypothetical protein [Brevibacillus sp. SAFN-007a]|uniref:hypothetical protein n=1 Tax=Brevibacillus sp. SAFN-007a TaxID=3436862 RepID=UPI003F7D2960